MAIVNDWQKPLVESLEAVLDKGDIKIKDLEQARDALNMLGPGVAGTDRLRQQVDSRLSQLETRYQEEKRKKWMNSVNYLVNKDTYQLR